MANTATLSTLLGRVAGNLDRTTFSTTTFITKAQATQWLNDGLMKIHYLLANSGEDYFKSSATKALVAGTASYALSGFTSSAADLYKIKGVDLIVGSDVFDVPRFMVGERNRRQDATASADSGYMYRLQGETIVLTPTPGSGTLRINYVPQFTKLSGDSDVVHASVPEGWEDYAVACACAEGARKAEDDPSQWVAKANELFSMMKACFEPRDQAEPLRVVDVHGRWDRSPWGA